MQELDLVAPFTGAWIEIILSSLEERLNKVAPFTGAWIEIRVVSFARVECPVAPFTGAWIEITMSTNTIVTKTRRSLHGGVD